MSVKQGRVRAGRVVLESLRLDFDPEEAVRERAERALVLGVGGFIIFGGEREQVARLVADLRARVERPLWMAADLERGAGQQFGGLPTLPPPGAFAAHPDPEAAARTAGAITARGARSVGVDLVFAPVLDLDLEPDNPIVGTRSFGRDPVAVAVLAGAWIEGCQEEGVVACGKHFPGHGRTTADSHEEIPVVDAPERELDADLLPYRRLAGRLGAVLTAHVAYPTLGVDGPATLSHALLTDLLRGDLGFEGVVATDAMNMSGFLDAEADAADDATEPVDPAVAALLAGCDLLLYPKDAARTIDILEDAAAADPEIAARIEEAVERSDRVRRRFLGSRRSGLERLHLRRRIGVEPDLLTLPDLAADRLEAAALGLLTIERQGELPEWLHARRPIRVIAVWDDREMKGRSPFGAHFVEELIAAGWQAALADPDERPERIPSIVLVASTPQAWKGTAGLTDIGTTRVGRALANPSGAYPVVFGHHRLLKSFGGTGICAWGAEPTLEMLAARKLTADVAAVR